MESIYPYFSLDCISMVTKHTIYPHIYQEKKKTVMVKESKKLKKKEKNHCLPKNPNEITKQKKEIVKECTEKEKKSNCF